MTGQLIPPPLDEPEFDEPPRNGTSIIHTTENTTSTQIPISQTLHAFFSQQNSNQNAVDNPDVEDEIDEDGDVIMTPASS